MEKEITIKLQDGKLDKASLCSLSLGELSQLINEMRIENFKLIFEIGIVINMILIQSFCQNVDRRV